MMNKKRTSQVGWGKYLLTLPLFAALLLVSYACKNKTSTDTNAKITVESIDTATVAPPPPPPVKTSIKFMAPKTEKVFKSTIKFTAPVIVSYGKDSVYYNGVERMPQYPGGDDALLKFIHDNINYPFVAASNGIEGRVTIRFVVSKTGEINDIKVIRGLFKECDDEAVRVVKLMTKWEPGMNKGEPVNVYYTLPVVFKLQK